MVKYVWNELSYSLRLGDIHLALQTLNKTLSLSDNKDAQSLKLSLEDILTWDHGNGQRQEVVHWLKMINLRKYIGIIIIILCLVIFSTTAVRTAWASPFTPLNDHNLSRLITEAHTAYNNGNFTKVISILNQELHLDPRNPRLLTNLVAAEGEASNFLSALYYFKHAFAVVLPFPSYEVSFDMVNIILCLY